LYLYIQIGVIFIIAGFHDYNDANRETEINFGISIIIAPIAATLMFWIYGGENI